jgi:hypothetical protein
VWLCVNKDGTEYGFSLKPKRNGDEWDCFCACRELGIGYVENLIGRKLTWGDEPVFCNDEATKSDEENR